MQILLEVLFVVVSLLLKKKAKETMNKPALFRW